jgi:hypothetical protein
VQLGIPTLPNFPPSLPGTRSTFLYLLLASPIFSLSDRSPRLPHLAAKKKTGYMAATRPKLVLEIVAACAWAIHRTSCDAESGSQLCTTLPPRKLSSRAGGCAREPASLAQPVGSLFRLGRGGRQGKEKNREAKRTRKMIRRNLPWLASRFELPCVWRVVLGTILLQRRGAECSDVTSTSFFFVNLACLV